MIYERLRDPARESIKQSPRSAAAGMRLVRSTAALQNEPIASSAPEATESRLIHLSSRAMVTPTSGPIIVGFTLSGSGPSRVLLRAAGPALAELGVTNWLVYPRIQLFDTAGEIILESTKDEVTHLGLSPWTGRAEGLPFRPTSTDAMRITTLNPGSYTVHIDSHSPCGSGVSVVEVFDLSGSEETRPDNRLSNLSVLAQVASAERALTARIVVSGKTRRRLLVRGIGPRLRDFGIKDPLTDLRIELYSPAAWGASNESCETVNRAQKSAATAQCGAFPVESGRGDTELLTTLEPGAYLIALKSTSGSTGRGLIEVYDTR